MSKRARGDAFASKYMEDGADVRHRDKRVSRGMAAILMLPALFLVGLSVFVGLANATASRPVPAPYLLFILALLVAFAALFVALSLSFAVLRTVVTSREVVVKYGLWGPHIALEHIRSCKVVDYEWTKFGGFGIRRGLGGVWAYVPGPGPTVELCYDDGGKEKRLQIGADDAQLLAAQINEARAAIPRLRVDASDDTEAERELEAAEEAELEASRARRDATGETER